MALTFRPTLSWSLLLAIVLVQISLLKGQDFFSTSASSSSDSASASVCVQTQDCSTGYTCNTSSSKCVRQSCNIDCSGEVDNLVCGSNGVTYRNTCELRKQQCVLATEITEQYPGACITLPPPAEHLCRAHQRTWDDMTISDYMDICNYMDIKNKADAGTLTLEDVRLCYRPRCKGDEYEKRQCSYNAHNWCWCSTSDGVALNDTFEKDKPDGVCSSRQSCTVDGIEYQDGALFSPPSGCGFCECLDGEHTCFEDYVPNVNGELNSTQLTQLKQEVTQVFTVQYHHDSRVLVDIRHIHQHPTEVSASLKSKILRWKFNYYDRNGDQVLVPGEQFIFKTELYEFVRCRTFFDHVNELIDRDSSGDITQEEWNQFFAEETQVPDLESGSAPLARERRSIVRDIRKPLSQRKKFKYILYQ